jgi:cytosine/adenosine deaminase-related metal-dependent hydrolase
MLKYMLCALAALLLGSGPARADHYKASPPLAMELRHAQWFDGRQWQRGSLYVQDGRFSAQRPKKVNRLLELRGQYLVGPLAEAHNHNLQSEWGLQRFGQDYLRDGVFYAAMLCMDPSGLEALRAYFAQQEAPDVLFASACITSSDGQPLAMLQAGQSAPPLSELVDRAVLVMDSPADVQAKWPLVAPRQSDLVKVIMSYHERADLRQRPELRGKLGVSAEVLQAVVQRAHAERRRVVVHVESLADFAAAVQAGADLIAELPGYFPQYGDAPEDHLISPELAQAAARQKVQVITATVASSLFQSTPELLARIQAVQKQNLQRLAEAGVPLLLGSDMFTGNGLDELQYLAKLQALEPAALLRMATRDTARALYPERRLGCFEPGCEASFLVLASNPLDKLAALDKPLLRIKQGRVLTQLEDVAATAGSTDTLNAAKAGASKPAKASKGKTGKASKPAGKSSKATPAKKPAAKSGQVKKASAPRR